MLQPYMEAGELRWQCDGPMDPELVAQLCSDAPVGSGAAGLGSALAALGGGGGAGGAAPAPGPASGIAPGPETCSKEFRSTRHYAELDAAGRDALRHECNLWKLDQVELDR